MSRRHPRRSRGCPTSCQFWQFFVRYISSLRPGFARISAFLDRASPSSALRPYVFPASKGRRLLPPPAVCLTLGTPAASDSRLRSPRIRVRDTLDRCAKRAPIRHPRRVPPSLSPDVRACSRLASLLLGPFGAAQFRTFAGAAASPWLLHGSQPSCQPTPTPAAACLLQRDLVSQHGARCRLLSTSASSSSCAR